MNKILAVAIGAILFITACKPEKVTGEGQDPIDAKASLNLSFEKIKSCAQTAHDGELADFFMILIEEGDADFDVDWVDDLLVQFEEDFFEEGFYEENEINFSSFEGSYAWDAGSESFIKTEQSGVFQVSLPTNPDNQSNLNFVGTISNYSEKEAMIDGERYSVPATISANVKYNGSTLAAVSLDELTLDNGGSSSLPISVVASLTTAPYNHFIALSRRSARDYSLNYSLETGGDCRFEINVNAQSNTDTYEEFDVEENLENVNGNILAGGLRYEFTADVTLLTAEGDLTAAEYNRAVDVKITQNQMKIAELTAVNRDGDIGIDVVYSDGSSENFEDMAEILGEDLADIFSDFE